MENSKMKKIINSYAFRVSAAGVILFVAALLFVPSSGVLRTIPFFVLAGILVHLLDAPDATCVLMGGVMTLCTYSVSGRSVMESLLFSVVSCLLTASGIYIARLARIMKNSDKKIVKKKGVTYIAVSAVVSLALSFVLCGNAVSFVISDLDNTSYITQKYADSIEKRYTCYESSKGEYCTYVSFKDGKDVYGNDDDCYISRDNDDVRNYREEKMLYSANAALSEIIVGATYGFNVVASDIDFEEGEILAADSDVGDYLERIDYVVSFDSIIGENEKEKFARICADTVSEISKNNFEFANIMFCAGNASDVLFCAAVTPDTLKPFDSSELVRPFDESYLEGWGVTEKDILEYWKN